MKKMQKFFTCLQALLKKNFFNYEKNDIPQGCENVFGIQLDTDNANPENEVEEYLNNYQSTTRWQTV